LVPQSRRAYGPAVQGIHCPEIALVPIVVVIVISVIHLAVLALPFQFAPALLDILAALSMTVNFPLKILLSLANAFFAIASCIGH
jgi:hypothetical protein